MKKIMLLTCLCAMQLFAADVKPLPIGSKAPGFSLPGIDGKTLSLQDFNNSVLVVKKNFSQGFACFRLSYSSRT